MVVVASAELDRSALEDVLEPGDEVHVVVPAVRQSFLEWLANDEDEARRSAEGLGRRLGSQTPGGAESVEATPDTPSQAVADAIAEHDPDRVVVAVRAGVDASWLEEGELDRLPDRLAGVPLTRITVQP